MRRTGSAAHAATKGSLEDEIAHLRDLDLKGLRARWKGVFRRQPPLHVPRHLLFAVLAYRLQADELGDLVPDTVRLLKQIGSNGTIVDATRLTAEFDRRRIELKPGTILTRAWNGQLHRVMVVDAGRPQSMDACRAALAWRPCVTSPLNGPANTSGLAWPHKMSGQNFSSRRLSPNFGWSRLPETKFRKSPVEQPALTRAFLSMAL
jgi:hypothetical protein